MAKYCPIINGPVLYLECLECEEKECKKPSNNNTESNKRK